MKKFLLVLVTVAVIMFAAACSFEKLYSFEASFGSFGICVELSSSDPEVQDAAIKANYKQGPCPSTYTGKGCQNIAINGAYKTTTTAYYRGYTTEQIQQMCYDAGGTLK